MWILILGLSIVLCISFFAYQYIQAVDKAKMLKIESEILKNDAEIQMLGMRLTPYPPVFKDTQEKQETTNRIEIAAKNLKLLFTEASQNKFIQKNSQAKILWQTAEIYRLEHNLDIKEAFQNAETYSQLSINTDPTFIKPYLTLGMLYVNSDLTRAHDAENLFLKAKNLAKNNDDLRTVYSGLWFSYYYQFQIEKALVTCKEALQKFPGDKEFLDLVTLTETVMKKK